MHMNDKDLVTKGTKDGEQGGNADAVKSKDTQILASMLETYFNRLSMGYEKARGVFQSCR